MASLNKHGNTWCIYYRLNGERFRYNTGINHESKDSRKRAELVFKQKFGTPSKARNTESKILELKELKREEIKIKNETLRTSIKVSEFLSRKSEKTAFDYRRHLKYLIDFTNDKYLNELTFSDLENLRSELSKGKRTANGMSGIFRGIRAFINDVIKYDDNDEFLNLLKISRNIRSLANQKKKEKRHFTKEEFELLVSFISQNEDSEFELTYINFALQTGVRLIECLRGNIEADGDGYKWTFMGKKDKTHTRRLSQDLAQSWLVLQSRIQKDDDGLQLESSRKSISNAMSIQFTRACKRVLLYTNPQFLATLGIGFEPSNVYSLSRTRADKLGIRCLVWLYASKNSKSIKELTATEKAEAMTDNWSFHSLRHTWNTEMNKDMNLSDVSKIIGHSSEQTTQGYVHINQYEIDKKHSKRIFN